MLKIYPCKLFTSQQPFFSGTPQHPRPVRLFIDTSDCSDWHKFCNFRKRKKFYSMNFKLTNFRNTLLQIFIEKKTCKFCTCTWTHLRNIRSPQKCKPTAYNTFVNNSLLNAPWAFLYFFIINLAYLQQIRDLQCYFPIYSQDQHCFSYAFFKTRLFQENKTDVSLSVEEIIYFTRRLKSFLDLCFKLLVPRSDITQKLSPSLWN